MAAAAAHRADRHRLIFKEHAAFKAEMNQLQTDETQAEAELKKRSEDLQGLLRRPEGI